MSKTNIMLEQYSDSVSVKVKAIRSFPISEPFHQEEGKSHTHPLTAIPNRTP